MIDEDIVQRIKVGGLFFLEIYRVTTGTLLSLFIPQSCGEQICTLKENLEDSDPYHQKVLAWNILTGTLFIFYYLIEKFLNSSSTLEIDKSLLFAYLVFQRI